jgi:quercetin dioxygenase-like cupin family protein
MAKVMAPIVATLALAGSLLFGSRGHEATAFQATPAATVPVIVSEVLGHASPAAVNNPDLALGRVTIMPGAAIASHYHPGTQIGVVVQGELTYTVFTGAVSLFRAPGGTPQTVSSGQTVEVEPGDALVEPPGSIHQGRNAGQAPVVIYLSTLFPAGAPRAILAVATPIP